MRASLLGIRNGAGRLLTLAAAGWLLAVVAGLVAGPAALAHPQKRDEQAAPAPNTMSFPIARPITRPTGRASAMRTRRAPDAGSTPLPPPTPRLGQIPSVAGGIPRLNAAGFAPNAPVFSALQPVLPVVAPWPRRDRGRGQGRDHGKDHDDPHASCVENDSGVTVWRGNCGN